MIKIIILGLPILVLLLPFGFLNSAFALAAYLLAVLSFRNIKTADGRSHPSFVSEKLRWYSKKEVKKQSIVLSIVLAAMLSHWFYQRWTAALFSNELNQTGLYPGKAILILIAVFLGAAAYPGLFRLIRYIIKNRKVISEKLDCRLFSLALTVLAMVFYGSLQLYKEPDNWILSVIYAKIYDPNQTLNMYVNPVISWILDDLSVLLPKADIFTLLLITVVFLSVWFWLYWILKNGFSIYTVLSFWFLIMIVGSRTNLFIQNYTLTAAFSAASGFYGLLFVLHTQKNLSLLPASLLIFMGFCLRWNGALIAVPFFALALGVDLIQGSFRKVTKSMAAKVLRTGLAAMLIPVLMYQGRMIGLSGTEMKEFNDNRTLINDYPHHDPTVITQEAEKAGLSLNDLLLPNSIIYADTDFYNAERTKQIASVMTEGFSSNIEIFKANLNQIFNLVFLFIACIYTFISIWLIINCRAARWWTAGIIMTGLLTAVILFYFCWKGRIPERVSLSVIYGSWICWLEALKPVQKKTVSLPPLVSGFLVLISGLVWACSYSQIGTDPKRSFADVFSANDPVKKETHYSSDGIKRIWGVFDFDQIVLSLIGQENSLPPDTFFESNIPDGEWVYGQDYFESYLDRISMENPMELLADSQVRYVGDENRAKLIEIFLQEHYSADLHLVEVEPYYGFHQWIVE